MYTLKYLTDLKREVGNSVIVETPILPTLFFKKREKTTEDQ